METLAFGLACNQVSPCAFAAPPRQRSHLHGLLLQLPCSLAASLWQPLHSHEQRAIVVGLPTLSGRHHRWAAIVVGPPSLSGCHHHWAVIVVGLPSYLGCHHRWAAIATPFPRATSEWPIFVGLHCHPILLGCLRMPCLLSSCCHRCPVPTRATNCLCTRLTPVTLSYTTIAFCCPRVYQKKTCHDGKPHVCLMAP